MTEGRLWGFALWMAGGGLFFVLGLAAFVSKKAVGFWANIKTVPMKDKKGYNRTVGKLWIVYGIVFWEFPFFGNIIPCGLSFRFWGFWQRA